MKKPFRIDYEKIKRNIYHELYQLNDDITKTRVDLQDLQTAILVKLKAQNTWTDPVEAMRVLAQFAKILHDMEARRDDRIKMIHELYEQEDAERAALEAKARGVQASKQNHDSTAQKLGEAALAHLDRTRSA